MQRVEREFFNYTTHTADSRWSRRTFVRQWWRIYGADNRWAPPHHARLLRALDPQRWDYIGRQRRLLIHMEAVERRASDRATRTAGISSSGVLAEQPVSAAVCLSDPQRQDRTGTLALLRFVNDEDPVERLLWTLMERGMSLGVNRLLGPTGLSPHLQSGVLLDHFHLTPPLHTPYNPPYVPEVIAGVMEPAAYSRLYRIECGLVAEPDTSSFRGVWRQATPGELLSTVGPLATAVLADHPLFPAPDAEEWAFMLDWLQAWPLEAWLLCVDEQAVGFVLLQPDLASAAVRAKGGRNPAWRAWLAWRKGRPADAGRIVLGGVLPARRRQGIGRALLEQAVGRAQRYGWRTLTVGPVLAESSGDQFLQAVGATPQQRYALFAADI